MQFFQIFVKKNNRYVWYTSAFFSIALLSLVLYQIDFNRIKYILNSISWDIFIIAIIVLLLEGIFTTLRFKLFTPGNPSITSCLKLTSIFIVSLILLPARLGEVAVIFLLKNQLNQNPGASVMNVFTQRFIDLIFLGAMLLSFIIINKTIEQNIYLYAGVFFIIILLIISIYKLDILLGSIATFFYKNKFLTSNKIFKTLFRMLLQARIWFRFHLDNKIISKAILISAFKWASNIGGLTLLFYSINTPLNEIQLLLTSTAYNLLAIIPLQTIGGFGISEAGLTGILVFFGLPIDLSASISIMSRIVLISTPFIFFILVYSFLFFNRNEKIS